MMRGNGMVVLIEEFECEKNANIITSALYIRCSRLNSYSLKINREEGKAQWIGSGCSHHNEKVGKKISVQETLEILRKCRKKSRETINKQKAWRHHLMIATRYIVNR